MKSRTVEKLKKAAEKELTYCSAHAFDHVMRVYNMALHLANGETVDMEVIKAAALLHDIGGGKEADDPTGKTDHAVEGAKMAKPILQKLGYHEDKIKHIQDCIITHRYRTNKKPKTLEAKIVFDADKLDSTGAIGVARALGWVGRNNAYIYRKVDTKKYAKENLGGKIDGRIQDKAKHSIHMNWETKDKHILGFLHTRKAKKIAKERMNYYKSFLDRLESEVTDKVAA